MSTCSPKPRCAKPIAAATLAAILVTATACGGDGGNGGEERLHPVIPNHIYLQIQEDREYLTLWEDFSNRHLSDRINAIHEEGYEIQHTTRDRFDKFILIFRKIPRPEESASPVGTTPAN